MIHRPHLDTRTDSVSQFRGKIRSALPVVLATVLAIVVISWYFDLPTYASSAYARFVGSDHQMQHESSSVGKQLLAGGSGRQDEGSAAPLYRGKLALSVPRLGLKDVPVPSGSSQAELNNQGIMRLERSGVPWSKGSNTSIIGHRIGFPQTKIPYVFYKLGELKPKDKILVEDSVGKKYVFEVYDRIRVPPSTYWLTHPVDGKTVISLQTCTPIPTYVDRLIVRGELVSVSAA